MKYEIADPSLAQQGLNRIEWADRHMPVLGLLRDRFGRERPLEGHRIGACLHITTETANLARLWVAGGAELTLCASNPLSTQDDVAAALVEDLGVPTFAVYGADKETYYRHVHGVLDAKPTITVDDGCDLVFTIHGERTELIEGIVAGAEETTTGVIRLRSMASSGALKYPMIAVNDANTKHLFDNHYGTGQSTIDGLLRATNVLLAGKAFVICGYGSCGRGVARRADGMGARVVVTEVDPLRALQAAMDGYTVMPIAEAAAVGEIFITVTGDKSVIRGEHFESMKDGAILANSGHFDVEIDLVALGEMSEGVRRVRSDLEEYALKSGRKVYVVGEGRLANLAAAEGHPASVMDMSFANQALVSEYIAKSEGNGLSVGVHDVPQDIDEAVARLKLEAMGLNIDTLTPEQEQYLSDYKQGT